MAEAATTEETARRGAAAKVGDALAAVGRPIGRPAIGILQHVSGVFHLARLTLYFTFVGPFTGKTKLRKLLFPMMSSVGVKSAPIVALVSFLIGAILVLQTGAVLKKYGSLSEVPGVVALSITRELGPLMTAIVLTARVGASFTAVLASMKINDEIMALETMAVHPVGYLVAPRFIAMLVMVPCLTVFSYLVGMVGGWFVAINMFDLSTTLYIDKTVEYLVMSDLWQGLVKSVVFGTLISLVCCYYGFITEGGPVGLGRNTMIAVVTTLVLVITADALATGFIEAYLKAS
jgi:phospholipid/cholesterol/gamma-HCH transport system permease protein